MILRCDRSKKRPGCTGFVGAVPNGAMVLRALARSSECSEPEHYVLGCLSCGTLYEVAPPRALDEVA